ncbi:MAG: aminoglycoside phosphotransferase family protein [Candidatus Heimdallarchaeota archaeon]|nr:aminoglycoside phosphotransferase family protein [Candidatus Heimdallarchaeota archaeon]MCK4289556.1 aminoglycoside phosphotransferase family protein [Candidatus Heimdallarchaeota archaeon]
MSFYEEMNPADISVDEVLPFVRKFLPDVQSESIHFFYHGTYNVFEIDKKYILRVADREFRNKQGLEMLRKEHEILDFIRNKVLLSIPEILYLHDSIEIPFTIHKKIPGKSLVFISPQLTKEKKKKVGLEIGRFLSILHSVELKNDYLKCFPKQNEQLENDSDYYHSYKTQWINRYEEAKEIAFQYLNQKQKIWLTKIFEDYLTDDENFTFSPRITHCDFDTSNILIEPTINKLTGVIDFEECKIWDPAVDLLFFDEGPEFMKAILDNYTFSKQKSLLARMKFYYSRTCVPYLVWGTTHNRPGMIDEGMKRIIKNMKMFPK